MSQENVSDKVRNLQRQIAQSIKFGQKPPSLRKSEDEGSSDEEVPQSPLKVLAQLETVPAETEPKQVQAGQQAPAFSTPVKSPRSKRVLPPSGTIESINLDAVPQSVPLLDNTAAKHKLSVKPKNQRVSRKHRRFTQDLKEVSIPGVLQEHEEAAGAFTEEPRLEPLEVAKKQRLHYEERIRQEEEEEKGRKAEEKRLHELEEERCRQDEERVRREEGERKQRELEVEMRRRRLEEEERRLREEEEHRRREEEEQKQREEEEEERRRMQEEEECRQQEEEEKRHLEEQRRREEEERRQWEFEAEQLRLEKRMREEREEERKNRLQEERKRTEEEEAEGSSDHQDKKRKAEELRWREMEERQRPFSFKVSSGEKQILFQKVNLSPVTPASSQQGGTVTDQRPGTKSSTSEGGDSPNLPSSQYVPHTAILVTGAQLCGPAVNLDQIKDTACKSLLGIGEDRKAQGTPPAKGKTSPDQKSRKTKSLNESMVSTDQSSAAVLAEWASIRSKIFKGAEEGKYEDNPETSRSQMGSCSEDVNQPLSPHTNLRKTMSASAKFSITPAKKKFGDSNRNSDLLSPEDNEARKIATPPDTTSPTPPSKSPNRTSKTVRIVDRGSEECMFAKDLPSFLVPSHQAKPEGVDMKGSSQGEAEGSESMEGRGQDKLSPFGIKLRRTNYSLRFHSEQSIEKRKKRYSAGDSFDGVPSPLTPIDPDSDPSPVFLEKSSPPSPLRESAGSQFLHTSPSPVAVRAKPGLPGTVVHGDGEKVPSRKSLYQRPNTSAKSAAAVATPPTSPLPKAVHEGGRDEVAQRTGRETESPSKEQPEPMEERSAVARLQKSSHGHTAGDEEPKEKKSFFPSINIPWREKADRKTELMRKEKPSLQSRHSLDSTRLQEKEQGPLWITLALQKQKGFREQQQTREERRSQREAKLAEKHSRERESALLTSPMDARGHAGPSPVKVLTPEEPKRPDSLLGRFDRKEHLKKANTLPSSVTVEIADSTPSPPAVKEVSKRFPTGDSPQVSTEPAWLALAKRKAKAWSDCPQIIK